MRRFYSFLNYFLAKVIPSSTWYWLYIERSTGVITTDFPANIADLPEFNPQPFWLKHPSRPIRMAKTQWCFLSEEGVLFHRKSLIEQVNVAFADKLFRQWNAHYRKKCFEKRPQLQVEECALIWDDWGGSNYYHWMCESLPRLSAFLKTNRTAKILLPPNPPAFIQESLRQLFPDIQTKELRAGRLNLFQSLWVQDYLALNVPHPSVLFIREQMLNKVVNEVLTSNPIKLGILRKGTLRRRIVNEVDYFSWCTENGIQLIDPGDYSFLEQVVLFSKANFLIAPHGAGETNMLFMRPNSIIIELNNETASDATLCYLSLAGHLSFRFYYLPAKVQGYDLEFDVEFARRFLKDLNETI